MLLLSTSLTPDQHQWSHKKHGMCVKPSLRASWRGALQMCIMAGCDFLPSLPGVGLKKAHQQLRKVKGFVKVNCMGVTVTAPVSYF